MFLISLLAAGVVAAAPSDAAYDRCMQKAVTNADFSTCGSELLKRDDVALNAAWKAAYAKLDTKTKSALLTEQRAWNSWKEKSCLYLSSGAYGREGQAIRFYSCRADVIEARIAYLRNIGGR